MGRNAQIAHAGIGGEHELDRGREPAGAAPGVEDMGDGSGTDRAAREGLGERDVEGTGAHLIEQAQ